MCKNKKQHPIYEKANNTFFVKNGVLLHTKQGESLKLSEENTLRKLIKPLKITKYSPKFDDSHDIISIEIFFESLEDQRDNEGITFYTPNDLLACA